MNLGSYVSSIVAARDRTGLSTQTQLATTPVDDGFPFSTFTTGDVFVAVGDGKVQWRHSDGVVVAILDAGGGGETAGMAFDSHHNLFVTSFEANKISRFDPHGNLIDTFGGGYDCHPESIAFDRSGNLYIGQADCGSRILKLDSSGKGITTFSVLKESRGSDWLDLAADQCTIYYTSQGKAVKRFNVCTNTQLSDFAIGLPGSQAFALRLLPGGGLLVADQETILRLDDRGKTIQSYTASGKNYFFALNLDPDGTSFWSADLSSKDVYKFDISTGRQILTFNAGESSYVGGLTIFGELTVGRNTTEVAREGKDIRITFASSILFDFNRYELKREAEVALSDIAAAIFDQHPGVHLVIEGHTDDVGSQSYNLKLSTQRAQSVADWLVQHGVKKSLIEVKGYGMSHPKVPNNSDENRERNRRVEIVVKNE
jgi:outer membrane protein OmpA-like peptidoglycan-associated protein/streptogramin lyase